MEVSVLVYAPVALPAGKEPPVFIEYEAGWAPESCFGDMEKREFTAWN
jgi:hypothetical protein